MEPTIYKPSIYKGTGIYKIGAEGGGADINKILSENCFLTYVNKMSHDIDILNYDARLDIDLYKLTDLYEKVDGVKNIDASHIKLDITSDKLDVFISFWINSHSNYSSILSNDYIDNDTNNFGIYMGSISGQLICLVDTSFRNSTSEVYQNGSALEINNMGVGTPFCKDVFYPFYDFRSGMVGAENISNIGIFPADQAQVTIFSLTVFKAGILVMDLVPCVRRADNVAGFFNKIDASFIYNEEHPERLQGVKLF